MVYDWWPILKHIREQDHCKTLCILLFYITSFCLLEILYFWEGSNLETRFLICFFPPWPPVREVCPSYYVVMFQPWTGTSPDLVSITNCYVDMIISRTPPFPSTARCPPGGSTHSCHFSISLKDHVVPTHDHLTTRASPVFVPEYRDPLLPDSDSSTSSYPPPLPRLLDPCRHALATTKIDSNGLLKCFRAAVSCHHS